MNETETLSPVLPGELQEAAWRLLQKASERELMLATAESCTGGLLASLLTDIPGCSHAFERGFVVYTDAAKHELLGVPPSILDIEGAVSEAAALALAQGALDRSRADVVAAITGFTDAGPSPEEEAGLVHFASARRGSSPRHRRMRFGDIGRARVRQAALETALRMMREDILAI